MGMSRGMYAAGAVELAVGALILFTTESQTWGAVGVALGAMGGMAIGLGFALGAIGDPVEREVDRWEENWGSTWTPICPMHGDRLCIVKHPVCPSVREREDV